MISYLNIEKVYFCVMNERFNSIKLRGINNVIACNFPGNDIWIPNGIVNNVVNGILCIIHSSFRKLPEFTGMVSSNCCYK